MTTEVRSQTLAANVPGYFGQGRIWFLKTATGPVTISCQKSGQGSSNVRNFINVAAGFKFKAEIGDGWDILTITSANAQYIELVIGDDDVEVSSAVSVNGSVTTIESPTTAIATAAFGDLPDTNHADIPQNIARKRITISVDPNSAGFVYVRDLTSSAALAGVPIQAGMGFTFATSAALRVINFSGATARYMTFEET